MLVLMTVQLCIRRWCYLSTAMCICLCKWQQIYVYACVNESTAIYVGVHDSTAMFILLLMTVQLCICLCFCESSNIHIWWCFCWFIAAHFESCYKQILFLCLWIGSCSYDSRCVAQMDVWKQAWKKYHLHIQTLRSD